MRRPPPALKTWSGLPAGAEFLPLGLLMIAGCQFAIVTLFILLFGIPRASLPQLQLNAVLATLVFLVALVWVVLRFLRFVTPETGTGFSLAAFGLAARTLVEVALLLDALPRRAAWPSAVSPTLVLLVRSGGLIAYVTGVAFVVAMSAQAIARRPAGRDGVSASQGMWIAAASCLAAVVLLVILYAPQAIHLLTK